jgi:hypothetical protein
MKNSLQSHHYGGLGKGMKSGLGGDVHPDKKNPGHAWWRLDEVTLT